jgi:hypothetical protein
MTNDPFAKFTIEERKAILDYGSSHPRYAELMRAYDRHAKVESRRIDAAEADHYRRLGI